MRRRLQSLAILLSMLVLAKPEPGAAKTRLVTLNEGVIVYSGPGRSYRPLAVLPARSELPASTVTVPTSEGPFFKVLVQVSPKRRSIGYIPITANAQLIADGIEDEDLARFGGVALINKALQGAFTSFNDQNNMWTLGYMHYLKPGFYVKGFAGRFLNPTASATVGGAELGNDALLFGPISGLTSFAAGIFSPTEAGTIFEASSNLNAMMQAAVGARYNIKGAASISAAASQAVLFNANNSLVLFGVNITIEVGL